MRVRDLKPPAGKTYFKVKTRGLRNPRTRDCIVTDALEVFQVMRVLYKSPDLLYALLQVQRIDELPRGDRYTTFKVPQLRAV